MIYLITLYSILSALAVVLNLMHDQYIPAFGVAFLSAAAFISGRELRASLTYGTLPRKLGRGIYALILLAVALYLSDYRINLYYYTLPGLHWCIIGFATGLIATTALRLPRARAPKR